MEYPKGIDEKLVQSLIHALRGEGGELATVRNIQSWEPVGELPCTSFEMATDSVLRAHAISETWSRYGAYSRSRILYRFLKLVVRYYEPIIGLSQLLSGKSWLDASDEYFYIITQMRGLKRTLKYLWKPRRGSGTTPMSTYRVWRRPMGVVGMFTAADSPLAVVCDILNPIMAGNVVVNFVTPQGALGALMMKALLMEAGMPLDVWRVVIAESSDFGMNFIPALDYVSATGPSQMCRRISMECAKHSIPMSYFGGVKNIAIVMEDSKLWDAAKSCARSAFRYAGQSAMAVEVVFVQDTVKDLFEQLILQYTQDQIRVGRYIDRFATMGSMMRPDRVDNCHAYVEKARENGARVVIGSHPRPEISPTFFEPTIVADLPLDKLMLDREVYGPMLTIVPFSDITEVMRKITSSRVINSTSLFTRDMDFVGNFIDTSGVSTVSVNDTYMSLYSAWRAPIQGKEESGEGIRQGPEALLQYTRNYSAARLKRISWVPKDWRSGNWTERLTFGFMGLNSWMSRNVTDTVLADGAYAVTRKLRDKLFGPV